MKPTCQICEREIQANNAKGLIAHHGYQRPDRGSGWQTASCWGARHLPYEVSCDQIQPCIDHIVSYIENHKKQLKELMENPPAQFTTRPHWIGDKVRTLVRPEGFDTMVNEEEGLFGAWSYEAEIHHEVYRHQTEIRTSQRDVTRLEKRLAAWVAPKK